MDKPQIPEEIENIAYLYLSEKNTISHDEAKDRFELAFVHDHDDPQGKHGRVYILQADDPQSTNRTNFVVKKNRADSPEERIAITEIEHIILGALKKEGLPVVDSEYRKGEFLVNSYVQGTVVGEYIKKHGDLPHHILSNNIDCMFSIQRSLEHLINENNGPLGESHKTFLQERPVKLITTLFNDVTSERAEEGYYTWRVLREAGLEESELLLESDFSSLYSGINATLRNAPQTWISFDHSHNRIINQPESDNPKVIRYDFNHLERGYWGLDLALALTTLGFENLQEGSKTIIDYTHLGILKKNSSDPVPDGVSDPDLTEVKSAVIAADKKLASPGSNYSVDLDGFLGIEPIKQDAVSMYAAYTHRILLSVIRNYNQAREGNAKASDRLDTYLQMLRRVSIQGAKFLNNFKHDDSIITVPYRDINEFASRRYSLKL